MKRFLPVYQFAAGLCDAVTGLLLMIAPAFTLRLMGVHQAPQDQVFISFIGAFVFSVGCTYLVFPKRHRRSVWSITAFQRLCVGSFVAIECIGGRLELSWLSVSVTDLSLAAFQGWVVLSNRLAHD